MWTVPSYRSLAQARQDASNGAPLANPVNTTQGAAHPLTPFDGPPFSNTPSSAYNSYLNALWNLDFNVLLSYPRGYSTVLPPADPIQPGGSAVLPVDHARFETPRHPSQDAGPATGPAPLPTSGSTDTQFTFRFPLPTQPQTAPVEQQGQNKANYIPEGLAVGECQQEPKATRADNRQTQESIRDSGFLVPEVVTIHVCKRNPGSNCKKGLVCFDSACIFAKSYKNAFELDWVATLIAISIAPHLDVGRPIQVVKTKDLLLSLLTETASPTVSTHASQIGASSSSLDHSAVTSRPTKFSGSSTGKRPRSEEYQVNRVKAGRRLQWKRKVDDDVSREDLSTGDGERPSKKRKPADGEFICLICRIFGDTCTPLSRPDSLKRHIQSCHMMFTPLLQPEQKELGVLRPRKFEDLDSESLYPLIAYCITTQNAARAAGKQIPSDEDLASSYPDVVKRMQQTQPHASSSRT